MFTFAVRMTVVSHTEGRGKSEGRTWQRDTIIPAFNRDDAMSMASVLRNKVWEQFEDENARHTRHIEPVAITERHNGVKLERTVFTFDELNRICEDWTAPTIRLVTDDE